VIRPVITLTTDFGLSDSYAGQVKGAILSLLPSVSLVDITHSIPKYDVRAGALLLEDVVPRFPAGCIHLAVVDPGVGTERRRIIVEADDGSSLVPYYLIGPDNGLLGLAAPVERRRRVWEIIYFDDFPYFTLPTTFEGRDIFAPAAAMLAAGYPPPSFGNEVSPSSMVELEVSFPEVKFDGEMTGEIVRFDSFGNAITNISGRIMARGWMSVHLPRLSLEVFRVASYSEIPKNQLGVLVGSHGKLEFAVAQGSAKELFKLNAGDEVLVERHTPGDETPGE
jgi:S-adenosylmethionine hydrolase